MKTFGGVLDSKDPYHVCAVLRAFCCYENIHYQNFYCSFYTQHNMEPLSTFRTEEFIILKRESISPPEQWELSFLHTQELILITAWDDFYANKMPISHTIFLA